MATNNPKILTIVVVDAKSQPLPGAQVSISPSDTRLITNSAGEVQFTLGAAKKYDITASSGSNTVTVPFYVTENGAMRLVVNPIYVKSIEKQLSASKGFDVFSLKTGGLIIGIFVVIFIIWKWFKSKK